MNDNIQWVESELETKGVIAWGDLIKDMAIAVGVILLVIHIIIGLVTYIVLWTRWLW
jgi:hypothetical protein